MARRQLQFRLTIDSRLENIELVQVVLNDCLERMGMADDARHWFDLATREAVANAIKHGNHNTPGKQVEVSMWREGEELAVSVADEGEGFNPGDVGDPLSPENLLRPSGRGLFYMQSFMDRVDYAPRDSGGTVVTLYKRQSESVSKTAAASTGAADSDSGGDG